jgi:Response regulator containing CheY-like receiver, AAA-type ATPase, and DNA-binding domains
MTTTRPIRILVSDDDERVRQATLDILQHEGYEVAVARDGNELMRAYRQQAADLVLCDLFMPDKDGLELIGDLLKDFPEARIIAMSGGGYKGMLNVLHMARHLGAKDILAKPFGRAKLLEMVRRVLTQM